MATIGRLHALSFRLLCAQQPSPRNTLSARTTSSSSFHLSFPLPSSLSLFAWQATSLAPNPFTPSKSIGVSHSVTGMLMAMLSRITSAVFAFLIPCYHTWKALSHRPLSEPDLERWAMYWTCVGVFVAFENTAEWFVSWLPFYWEFRTLFLLFLALPQTQGSTWFYSTYVHPFFSQNEADIDAGMVAAQTKTVVFLQAKFGAAWEALWRLATTHGAPSQSASAEQSHSAPSTPPAQTAPGHTNLYAYGSNLFSNYGPWAMGAISKTFGAGQLPVPPASTPNGSTHSGPTPSPSPGMQSRKPFFSQSEASSSHSNTPPAFPTPSHY